MKTPFKFNKTLLAAVCMLVAGSALAQDGNTLRGPGVKAGVAEVTIDQIGTGNVTSKDGTAGDVSNDAVVHTGNSSLTLKIQQVGTGNALALASYTAGATNIGVFQTGREGGEPVEMEGLGNKAEVFVGSVLAPAGATTLLITQQGAFNQATANLQQFSGTVNIVQMGGDNRAIVSASGTSNAQFNIGQNGYSNFLDLTAGAVTGPVNINFGDVRNFGAKPVAGSRSYGNTATINLGASAGFNMNVAGEYNQIDSTLGNAYSYVDALRLQSGNKVQIQDNGGIVKAANVSVDPMGQLRLSAASGSEVAVYGGASSLNRRGVADLRTETTTGTVQSMSVSQSGDVGAGSSAIIGLNGTMGSNWVVAQSGAGVKTFQMDNRTDYATVNVTQAGAASQTATGISFAAASGSTFTLTQR